MLFPLLFLLFLLFFAWLVSIILTSEKAFLSIYSKLGLSFYFSHSILFLFFLTHITIWITYLCMCIYLISVSSPRYKLQESIILHVFSPQYSQHLVEWWAQRRCYINIWWNKNKTWAYCLLKKPVAVTGYLFHPCYLGGRKMIQFNQKNRLLVF